MMIGQKKRGVFHNLLTCMSCAVDILIRRYLSAENVILASVFLDDEIVWKGLSTSPLLL